MGWTVFYKYILYDIVYLHAVLTMWWEQFSHWVVKAMSVPSPWTWVYVCDCLNQQSSMKVKLCDFWGYIIKGHALPSHSLGMPAVEFRPQCWDEVKQPNGQDTYRGSGWQPQLKAQPKSSTNLSAMWVNHLKGKSLSSTWYSTLPRCRFMSEINDCCCLKPLCSRIVWYTIIDSWNRGESLPFLIGECQLINVDKLMEIENHYLATMTVVADSGGKGRVEDW